MVQLDSLRTVAVFAVIGSHYAEKYFRFFNWGYAGVYLFFVLSGFLITGILLRARDKDEKNRTSKLTSLKRFYLRRTLRIFPLYYAIVMVGIVASQSVRDAWLWHISYTVNFQMALAGKWIGITGPFWSLGVEEQFYLLWPLIMLFLPLRWLSPLLLALIAAGPFSRLICIDCGLSREALLYLPSSCLDALGLGALLAWSRCIKGDNYRPSLSFRCGGAVGIVSLVVLLLLPRSYPLCGKLADVLSPLSLSLVFVWLVSRCADGCQGIAGKMLEWRPSLYLGKISYGLYALHLFAPKIVNKVFSWLSISPPDSIRAVASVAATIVMASLSWFLFEKPINSLKDKLSNSIGSDKLSTKVGEIGLLGSTES
jgi:peptidoglycan/LPS O-acetylase OafA/YrhL